MTISPVALLLVGVVLEKEPKDALQAGSVLRYEPPAHQRHPRRPQNLDFEQVPEEG
jgi:hypothetical protein